MQEGTSRSNQTFYLARNGLQNVSIIAAETEGAAFLAVSVKAGKIAELPAITSIAMSLGARKVCQRAFEITQTLPVDCVVADDQAAVNACTRFPDDHRVVVKPACGAALAVAYAHADRLARYERVLIVVCGGETASLAQLQAWQAS